MNKIYNLFSICFLSFCGFNGFSQVEFTLNSGDLIPHDDGFFLGGVTYDFNNDGLDDYVAGCPADFDFEDYERRYQKENRCGEISGPCVFYDLHNESGEQQGFTYKNCIILPVCDAKYESVLDPPVSKGFIQMRPGVDTADAEMRYSYILSPSVRNIQSITMETTPDVHIQTSREIPYIIEYSKDGGETFVFDYFIADVVQSDGGYRAVYNAENNVDFAQIAADSKTNNIILRFMTNMDDQSLGAQKGQYVKVHKITIVADSASQEVVPLANRLQNMQQSIYVKNNTIMIDQGSLMVYNLSGKFIGSGNAVKVEKGLYLITSSTGIKKKLFIQ